MCLVPPPSPNKHTHTEGERQREGETAREVSYTTPQAKDKITVEGKEGLLLTIEAHTSVLRL